MTTSRLATLTAFMAIGFASVFLLPKSYDQPSGIRMELPDFIANWKGTNVEISEEERRVLDEASGTRFARKTYRNLDGFQIMVSIVLSGRDMSTSIHRPERCLKAQGWTVQESDPYAVSLPQRGIFPIEQLRSTRITGAGEETVSQELQTSYWFVGEKDICASHWTRVMLDNRDRIFRGVSQRWAFILVSSGVPTPQNPQDAGTVRKRAQDTMREFIGLLAPKIHLDTVRYQ